MKTASAGRRTLALSLCVLGCLCTIAAPAGSEPGTSLDAFRATWVRANREADDAAREAALQKATEPMSFLTRGVTRIAMRRRLAAPERLVIQVEGERVTIAREPGPTTAFEVGVTEAGATAVFERGELRRDWRHDAETHGQTTWRFSPDGQSLLVRRIIRNGFVGSPVDYTTTYTREAPTRRP